MKALFCLFIVCSAVCITASGQESPIFGGRQSLGVTAGYSPTSGHILIGLAERRRTFTAGFEYTRRFWQSRRVRLDYNGEFSPIFRESDPTLVGEETNINGNILLTPMTPKRVIAVDNNPLGNECSDTCSPIYPVYGHDETTFAAAISPIGARVALFQRNKIQPTFEANTGIVISSRDIPVDNSSLFNYQFTFGPGAQIFASRRTAVRLEYIYRHISNADSGAINPGIDQRVFKLTISRFR
ncbi:MAG: acyloxyacyl hydrolase [Terracidiphilus sp.]|jgi:hypothetical protein